MSTPLALTSVALLSPVPSRRTPMKASLSSTHANRLSARLVTTPTRLRRSCHRVVAPPSTRLASQKAVASAAAATETVVLHGFPTSSTSFLARFALNVKGVEYSQEPLEVERLPNGKPIPDGVKPYIESNGTRIERPGAIFNFINETFDGPSLLPEDQAGRARCRSLATLCATEVAPFGYYRALRLLQDELGVDDDGIKKWRQYWITHGFGEIEAVLANSPEMTGTFLHGDSITMADIFIMPQVHHSQLPTTTGGPFPLTDYPILEKVYKNCLKDPAFVKALPENNQ